MGGTKMSKQQVIEFFQTASKDEVLTEKIKTAINPSSLLAIAIEHGYEFSEEELVEFKLEQVQKSLEDLGVLEELSDKQLETVAGSSRFLSVAEFVGGNINTVGFIDGANVGFNGGCLSIPSEFIEPGSVMPVTFGPIEFC